MVACQCSVNKRFLTEDRGASNWLKEFMYVLSTDALQNTAAKKYDNIDKISRGRVIYTYLILCKIFQMSSKVKASMLSFIEFFERNGIGHYPLDNVLV